MRYSLDTSALLDGWVRYYPPDVFPTVWDKLDTLATSGHLKATEEVLTELGKKADGAYDWLKDRPHMVAPIDNVIQPAVTEILRAYPRLVGVRKFRTEADAFVIALAQIEDCIVVSAEQPSNNLSQNPKIPDICASLGIRHINLVGMFREQGLSI